MKNKEVGLRTLPRKNGCKSLMFKFFLFVCFVLRHSFIWFITITTGTTKLIRKGKIRRARTTLAHLLTMVAQLAYILHALKLSYLLARSHSGISLMKLFPSAILSTTAVTHYGLLSKQYTDTCDDSYSYACDKAFIHTDGKIVK